MEDSTATLGCSTTTIDLEDDIDITESSWSVRSTYRRIFTSETAA